jgi:hypothetical protein
MSSEISLLPGVNIMNLGPTGTGKTSRIGTLVDYLATRGGRVFFTALESGMEPLFGHWLDEGKEVPPNFHWHRLAFKRGGLSALTQKSKNIGSLPQDQLHKLSDPTRGNNNPMLELTTLLNDFVDQRDGKKWGSVEKWGTDRFLVFDGLSGLCEMAMYTTVGNKPVRSQPDWGIAMDLTYSFVKWLCDDLRCHFILISHIERETDEVTGGTKNMASALGRKLAPKLPQIFGDVILSVRQGTTWTWSTADMQTDLKTRNLPWSNTLPPDYSQLLDKWVSRGGRFVP